MIRILGIDPAANNAGYALLVWDGLRSVRWSIRLLKKYSPGLHSEMIGRMIGIAHNEFGGRIHFAYVETPPAGRGKMSSGAFMTMAGSYGGVIEALAVKGLPIREVPVDVWRLAILGKPRKIPINRKKKSGGWVMMPKWSKGGQRYKGRGVNKIPVGPNVPDHLSPAVQKALTGNGINIPLMTSLDLQEAACIALYGKRKETE